jgi:hypothetical protein
MGIVDYEYGGAIVMVDNPWGDSLVRGTFVDASVGFDSDDLIGIEGIGVGDTLGIMFWLEGNMFVDNVRFDVTPEPSTLVLLAAGLIAMAAYTWRKRK